MAEPVQAQRYARVLDARGLQCPLPVLKTKQALSRMGSGELLQVLATDPESPLDMAALCSDGRFAMVGQARDSGGVFEYVILRV